VLKTAVACLAMSLCLLAAGCSGGVKEVVLELPNLEVPYDLEIGQIPSEKPEASRRAIEASFSLGTADGFRACIAHAEFMLATWPEHPYAAGDADRAAFAALYLLPDLHPKAEDLNRRARESLELVAVARRMLEAARNLAKRNEREWVQDAAEYLSILRDGFHSYAALHLFAKAHRLKAIDFVAQGREEALSEALQCYEKLKANHRLWYDRYDVARFSKRLRRSRERQPATSGGEDPFGPDLPGK
jgi:hypothetical protein